MIQSDRKLKLGKAHGRIVSTNELIRESIIMIRELLADMEKGFTLGFQAVDKAEIERELLKIALFTGNGDLYDE